MGLGSIMIVWPLADRPVHTMHIAIASQSRFVVRIRLRISSGGQNPPNLAWSAGEAHSTLLRRTIQREVSTNAERSPNAGRADGLKAHNRPERLTGGRIQPAAVGAGLIMR